MIKIVTDTMSNVPAEIAQKYNLTLIPAYLTFGEETLRDQVDIQPAEFYKRLAESAELPSTSQPSVTDFTTAYQKLLDEDPKTTILSIHISSSLSGTLESGRSAAARLPDSDIRLFDTRSISTGQGLMVLETAKMVQADKGVEEILKKLAHLRDNMRLYFALDTLDYLAKGGRIGRGARLMGTLLDMKPILGIKDGALEPHDRYISTPRALNALREMVVKAIKADPAALVGILHANCEEDARRFAKTITAETDKVVDLICETGPAIGTHTGPGALGVCWYSGKK